jgi:hypothetical protein
MSTKRPPADPDIEPEYDFRDSVPNPYALRSALAGDAIAALPRISVRVPMTIRDKASARAASEGRTMSAVLRDLLEEYANGPVAVKARRRR